MIAKSRLVGARGFVSRREGEEFDDVRDVVVAPSFQQLLDLLDVAAEFRGRGGIDLLDAVRLFTDDVVGMLVREAERVEAGAVVVKRAANKSDVLESAEAAIHRHEVA